MKLYQHNEHTWLNLKCKFNLILIIPWFYIEFYLKFLFNWRNMSEITTKIGIFLESNKKIPKFPFTIHWIGWIKRRNVVFFLNILNKTQLCRVAPRSAILEPKWQQKFDINSVNDQKWTKFKPKVHSSVLNQLISWKFFKKMSDSRWNVRLTFHLGKCRPKNSQR